MPELGIADLHHYTLKNLTALTSSYQCSTFIFHLWPPKALLCQHQHSLLTLVSSISVHTIESCLLVHSRDHKGQQSFSFAFRHFVNIQHAIFHGEAIPYVEHCLTFFRIWVLTHSSSMQCVPFCGATSFLCSSISGKWPTMHPCPLPVPLPSWSHAWVPPWVCGLATHH